MLYAIFLDFFGKFKKNISWFFYIGVHVLALKILVIRINGGH
jgi:hypothetical protein